MTTRDRLAVHFPVFDLEVRTPRLTLRFPDDEDLVELADLATHGVHAADTMPFEIPWTRVEPPFQQRNTLQYFWNARCTLQGDAWNLPLVAVVDGEIAGSQGIFSKEWKATATFETGSWLGRRFQGNGLGQEMRHAALRLGFDGFGAERAITAAFVDNLASLGVTRALGYRPNGDERWSRGDDPVMLQKFVMDRDAFAGHRRDDIEIAGAAEVLELFGSERPPAF